MMPVKSREAHCVARRSFSEGGWLPIQIGPVTDPTFEPQSTEQGTAEYRSKKHPLPANNTFCGSKFLVRHSIFKVYTI
jgi:hypothetical protein